MSDPIINKDAATGRIVSDADAVARPDETYALEVGRNIELERAMRGALNLIEHLDKLIETTRRELGIERDYFTESERAQIAEWRTLVD
jgi:hypothetical protein